MQYDQGYAQQGYGAQQGYAQQVQWRIDAYYGVKAMAQERFPALPKCWYLPYTVRNGEDQVLSRWNMIYESDFVSRMQCMVKVLPDGTPTLVGCGKNPSLFRSQGGQWNYLQKGQTQILQSGDQVSLDYNNPESAVFTCTQEQPDQYGQQGQYQQGQQQGQGLPPGWISGVDPSSGAQYYYNEQTGVSQWEPPQQDGY